ncbi:MAG: hydrolase [Balneolaceae bacterium]|nr:MAG: hydrolase [Balneolaceae bacterium]
MMGSLNQLFKHHDFELIDAHVHLNSPDGVLSKIAGDSGIQIVTINTEVPFFPGINEQKKIARNASNTHFLVTFSTENWGLSGWQDEAIQQIEQGLNEGAVGVKIWKNIGMELQKEDGSYLMADDPSFDPIYRFLCENRVPLLAHLGEPKNCWLPVDEMTVTSDRDYFANHPQYHMYLHKEMPSYEDQIKARNRVLEKFPALHFIGAHLASIEWSVDELACWLNRYPSAGVDLAERVCHLQHQAILEPEKVRDFVETYQDRIIYGSDQIDDAMKSEKVLSEIIQNKWGNEFRFFSDSDIQTAWNVEKPFRGLGLDETVLKKIFRENALRYYPLMNPRHGMSV